MSDIPENLEDAIMQFPSSFEVRVRHSQSGWYFSAERPQHGGTFRVMSDTKSTWQEAFLDAWARI